MSRRNGNRGEDSVNGMEVVTRAGGPDIPRSGSKQGYTLATGRVITPEIKRDRIMTGAIQAIIPICYPQWSDQVDKTHFFQSGSAANFSQTVDNTLGAQSKALFTQIVRVLTSKYKIVWRDSVLDESGAGSALGSWLANYCGAFTTLMGLQGALNAGAYNITSGLISNAISQSQPRLAGDLDLLFTFAVPKKLVEYLMRIAGPKALTKDGTLIYGGLVGTTTPLDLTSNTNVNTYLSQAETFLQALSGASGGASTGDCARIANLFGRCYSFPKVDLKRGVSYDAVEYAMQYSSAFAFVDSTASKTFSFPNTNISNGQFPILVPKGAKGEGVKQLFSLLRTSVYSVDPTAGVADANVAALVGLFEPQGTSTNGSYLISYNSTGSATTHAESHAGAISLTYNNFEMDTYFWSPFASSQATDYTQDTRPISSWDKVYVTENQLIDETEVIIEEMFLGEI